MFKAVWMGISFLGGVLTNIRYQTRHIQFQTISTRFSLERPRWRDRFFLPARNDAWLKNECQFTRLDFPWLAQTGSTKATPRVKWCLSHLLWPQDLKSFFRDFARLCYQARIKREISQRGLRTGLLMVSICLCLERVLLSAVDVDRSSFMTLSMIRPTQKKLPWIEWVKKVVSGNSNLSRVRDGISFDSGESAQTVLD